MSATASGITYDVRLNAQALDGDLGQAEARVTASVQKMNALRVVIPVSLDLTAFNAQAAQVNSTLGGWQNGITIGGAGGGVGGGGASFTATQNNLTAIQQNVTAVQQIQQNFTQINQVAQQAAQAGSQAANSIGGLNNSLRALHRGLYALVAVAHTLELGGDLIDVVSAGTPEKNAAAIAATRQDIRGIPIVGGVADSLGHRIGNFAQAIGNSVWGPITGERGRGFESDEGYAERIGEEEDRREVQLKRMTRDAERGRRTARELETFADRANRAGRPNETAAERHANAVEDVNRGLAEKEREIAAQYGGRPLTPADQQRVNEARAATAAQVNRLDINYAREQGNFALHQTAESEALRLGNSGQSADARRVEFNERLRREREQAAREGAGAFTQFNRDIAPERQKKFDEDELRREEKQRQDSAQRVADFQGRINELSLRQAGQTYAADVQAYNRSWDQKLAKMKEAVDQETDVNEKRRRQDELDAARRERAADQAAYVEERKRQEESKTLEHESRLAVLRLQIAGNTEAASRNALAKQYDDRINRLGPNDPDRARLEEERAAALGAFDADRGRRTAALAERNRESDLRGRGQTGMAELLGIRAQAERDLQEAAGDPRLEAQIRERERQQVLELQHRAGSGRAEAVRPNLVDVTNRHGDKAEDQTRLLDAIWQTLKEISGKTGKALTS